MSERKCQFANSFMFLPHSRHDEKAVADQTTRGCTHIHTHSPPSSVFPMSQILAKVYTDVITVYSGKSFPGVVCKYYLGRKSDRICEKEHENRAVLYIYVIATV